jgi:uncharacterized protein
VIRSATVADTPQLIETWRAAGLRFYPETAERELVPVIGQDLVLVDERDGGEIAGTVFGSYDGVRGWVHRLATMPHWRGRGIASGLLAELERRLLAIGCPAVNLLIEVDNSAVTSFYAGRGYRSYEVGFMQKWLVPEPRLFMPNGLDASPRPSDPAAVGWRDIGPDLSAEPYVFAAGEVPPGISPFALIREDGGPTLILTQADADRAGLAYDYVAARITLRVNSDLADVGLTALFSRTLADAGISCNVIAGLAHDHLFVAWDQADRALSLLTRL